MFFLSLLGWCLPMESFSGLGKVTQPSTNSTGRETDSIFERRGNKVTLQSGSVQGWGKSVTIFIIYHDVLLCSLCIISLIHSFICSFTHTKNSNRVPILWDGKKRSPQRNDLSFPVLAQPVRYCCLRPVTSGKDVSWTFSPQYVRLYSSQGMGDGVGAYEIERVIFANWNQAPIFHPQEVRFSGLNFSLLDLNP